MASGNIRWVKESTYGRSKGGVNSQSRTSGLAGYEWAESSRKGNVTPREEGGGEPVVKELSTQICARLQRGKPPQPAGQTACIAVLKREHRWQEYEVIGKLGSGRRKARNILALERSELRTTKEPRTGIWQILARSRCVLMHVSAHDGRYL